MRKNELFQIGEVSKLFHISVSILRHYEKIGILKPEYVDKETGYRYYSVSQFECLNTIRYLRALDVPLNKIGGFLANRDVEQIRSLLVEQKIQVEQKRHELMLVEQKISRRLSQLDLALSTPTDVITLESKPPRRLAFLKRQIVPHNYLDLETSIRELEKQETCAVIRFQGSHGMSAAYYSKLMAYIHKSHLEPVGFSKEITMIDNGLTDDESQFVTEIQIPVN